MFQRPRFSFAKGKDAQRSNQGPAAEPTKSDSRKGRTKGPTKGIRTLRLENWRSRSIGEGAQSGTATSPSLPVATHHSEWILSSRMSDAGCRIPLSFASLCFCARSTVSYIYIILIRYIYIILIRRNRRARNHPSATGMPFSEHCEHVAGAIACCICLTSKGGACSVLSTSSSSLVRSHPELPWDNQRVVCIQPDV